MVKNINNKQNNDNESYKQSNTDTQTFRKEKDRQTDAESRPEVNPSNKHDAANQLRQVKGHFARAPSS